MRFLRSSSNRTRILLTSAVAGAGGWYTYKHQKKLQQGGQQSAPPAPEASVEESLVGEVGQTHARKPILFQWSSLPKFIEKRYDPQWPGNGPLWNAASTAVIGSVGIVAKVFVKYLAHTRVYNLDKFLAIVDDKDRNRPLITVSNHESVWDDPLLWGVLPMETLFSIHKMRWVLGAADICFTSLSKSIFFSLGQAVPTIRGSGIYQPAVDFAIHKANENGWIHIFPEARVNQSASMIRFKWGVGRIIMESERSPIVIPVWHNGMSQVRPLQGPPIRFFQPVTLAFGEPIDFQDTLDAWHAGKITEVEARIEITRTIFEALGALKKKTECMKRSLETGDNSDLEDTTRP